MTPPNARRVLTVLVIAGLIALAAVATWTWGVVPVRNWVAQRNEITRLEAQLAEVEVSNVALEAEIRLLQTDAEIERIARRDFGLVYPGEEAYAILPRPVAGSG
ncbi:MAG: septum formation initiator family protein [Acidimicrobiia bacterium]|nr:septum formation initiator family protein [Acidimicrobiia bacterium]